jgi:FAD/FMN-containing dehydrogenase
MLDTTLRVISTQRRLQDLQERCLGAVITPQDSRYDVARRAWNLTVDQRPAVIVQAQSIDDVSAAVRFAREAGLGISVQSTGHGVSRPADNAVLIITAAMTGVKVDAASQTAWVEAGAKWGQVLAKAQEVGLAPLLGSSPDVGVVGYTLGGGMGWLARKYGLALDSVLYFEVVTANGERLRVSDADHSDLFWALRGGGGSFAVIVGMSIRLYPVTMVYGGNLIYPAERAHEVFALYREWITTAPDELTSAIVIMNLPPIPQVPEPLRGKSVVFVRGCYAGPLAEGEALFNVWRERLAPPLADMAGPLPFSEVASISNDPRDPQPGTGTGAWLRGLDDEAVDTLIRHGVNRGGSSPLTVTELRHAGGAMARVDAHANAYSNRDAALLLNLIATTPTPESVQAARQFTEAFKADLAPVLTGSVYMNFLGGAEAWDRTRDAYLPESYQRLMAIKATYDPENLFRFGFNIPALMEAPSHH